MAALTDNKTDFTTTRADVALQESYLVDSAEEIFLGACVSFDAQGDIVAAAGTAAVIGFALNHSLGSATAPLNQVRVQWNMVVELPLSSVTAADLGKVLYASTDNDFTLTPNTSIVGPIVQISDEADKCWVHVTKRV